MAEFPDWRRTAGGRVKQNEDGATVAVYDLTELPAWRVRGPEDAPAVDPPPYTGMARWSGNPRHGMSEPPPIGGRVIATINGFGPATVTGYFVESGWLGVYLRADNPPAWWLRQMKEAGRPTEGAFAGPMVFGAELSEEGR